MKTLLEQEIASQPEVVAGLLDAEVARVSGIVAQLPPFSYALIAARGTDVVRTPERPAPQRPAAQRPGAPSIVTADTSPLGIERAIQEIAERQRVLEEGPAEAPAIAPAAVPGIDFSDQLWFWSFGYPAVMVTDTSFMRYAHYHESSDTPEKLDYGRMALVVAALEPVIRELAR